MKIYKVVSPYVEIRAGIVRVTPDQARSRRFALKHEDGDDYSVTQPVGFKHDETFGYDQDLPKCLAISLEEPSYRKPLTDMTQLELLAIAKGLGLKPDPKTGKKKLQAAIEAEQKRLQAEQEKADRIAELEALGDNRSVDETAELDGLTA